MGRKRDDYETTSNVVLGWLQRRSTKVKVLLAAALVVVSLLVLKLTVKNMRIFFLVSETSHAVGIFALIYKLSLRDRRSCAGLSLKSQELTALFLTTRFITSIFVEYNIHTVLDFLTLAATAWVIYMIRFKLKSTYMKDMDTFPIYLVVVPAAILAFLSYPTIIMHHYIFQILFGFSAYIEAVSVLPQLRLMQNAKVIEPFVGYYVFALGVSRFLSLAYWIIQTYDTRGAFFYLIGSGSSWMLTSIIGELVQSFILIDFCYYYIKSLMSGELMMRMPV